MNYKTLKHILAKHKKEAISIAAFVAVVVVFLLFKINAASGPIASNVKITGNPNVGETLAGSYDYNYAEWQLVGSENFGNGASTAFAIDHNNNKYAAYGDVMHKLSVKKFDGENWVLLGDAGFSSPGAQAISLAIDNSTEIPTPYVAFQDTWNGYGVTVMKFVGESPENPSGWQLIGSKGFTSSVMEFFFDVSSTGTPYVVYRSGINPGVGIIKKFDGNNWIDEGSTLTISWFKAFKIDSNNMPYVAYVVSGGSTLAVKRFETGNWVSVGQEGFSDGSVGNVYLDFDSNNIPYVVYGDWAYGNTATVRKYTGITGINPTGWELVGSPGFSDSYGGYASIAIDNSTDNPTPYVAFAAGKNVTLKKFDGTNWQTLVTGGFLTDVQSTYNVFLALDSNNVPFVQFIDNISYGVTVMKYNSDPEGESVFKWYRGEDEIPGATGKNYTLTADDQGKTISFEVTPVSAGDVTGSSVKSSGVVVNSFPTTTDVNITGTLTVGNELTGHYTYNDADMNWELVGTKGFSDGTADYTSLAIGSDGTKYVAYADSGVPLVSNQKESLWSLLGVKKAYAKPSTAAKATVMKYTEENGWQPVGTPRFSDGSVYFVSLAIDDSTQTLYVAYQDEVNNNGATVMKYSEENGWQPVGQKGFSDGNIDRISLAVYNGTPYVAYADQSDDSGMATVMKYSEKNGWQLVGTPRFSDNQASNIKIVVYNGTSYVAYADPGTPLVSNQKGSSLSFFGVKQAEAAPSALQKATVMKYSEENGWQPVGTPRFSDGEINSMSLFVYNGTPYVSYGDLSDGSGKATVMKYTEENGWQPVGTPRFSDGQAYNSKVIVYNGTPYVAYADPGAVIASTKEKSFLSFFTKKAYAGAASGKATVMKYSEENGWQPVGTPRFSDGNTDSMSLAIYNNIPYVAYKDFSFVLTSNSTKSFWSLLGIRQVQAAAAAPAKATVMKAVSDPEGVSTFKWYRDDAVIDGATSKTYTTTSSDSGKTIKFGVIPTATSGSTPGSEVQSNGVFIASVEKELPKETPPAGGVVFLPPTNPQTPVTPEITPPSSGEQNQEQPPTPPKPKVITKKTGGTKPPTATKPTEPTIPSFPPVTPPSNEVAVTMGTENNITITPPVIVSEQSGQPQTTFSGIILGLTTILGEIKKIIVTSSTQAIFGINLILLLGALFGITRKLSDLPPDLKRKQRPKKLLFNAIFFIGFVLSIINVIVSPATMPFIIIMAYLAILFSK